MSDGPTTTAAQEGPPSLATTSSVTVFGTLAWVWIAWVGAAVVFTAVFGVAAATTELDTSLWHGLGAGLQRWLHLLIGYTMVTEFGRMFVTSGVTRGQLARSALVALAALCALGGVVAIVGYAVEAVVYDRAGWTQRLGDGDVLAGGTELVHLYGEQVLTLAAFFTTGWLLGACYRSRPRDEANLLAIPCLVPAAVAQLLVRGDMVLFGFLDRFDLGVPAALGAALSAVVTAVGIRIAMRATREITP